MQQSLWSSQFLATTTQHASASTRWLAPTSFHMVLEHYVWFACFCDLSIAAVNTGYCTLHDDLLTAGTLRLEEHTFRHVARRSTHRRNVEGLEHEEHTFRFLFYLMTRKPHAWGLQFLAAVLICFPKTKYRELSVFVFFEKQYTELSTA